MKQLVCCLMYFSIVLIVPPPLPAQVNFAADPYTTTIGPVYGYIAQGNRINFQSIASASDAMYYPFGGGLASPEDDGYASLSLPFSFRFFSQVFPAGNPVFVSANGFALFGTTSTSVVPTNLQKEPASFGNQPGIVPLFTDLVARGMTEGGPGLYVRLSGLTGERILTIEWSTMQHFNGLVPTLPISFQLQLFEADSSIAFNYQSTLFGTQADRGGLATVGIRDTTFTDPPDNVLQWGYQTAMPDGEGYLLGGKQFQILFTNLASVPEPTSLALAALGGTGLLSAVWYRRRLARRKTTSSRRR